MRLPTVIAGLFLTTNLILATDERTAVTNLPSGELFPSLSIAEESGKAVVLLSLEAYRAEFRHLRKTLHEIDLKGPAVETDGWTHS